MTLLHTSQAIATACRAHSCTRHRRPVLYSCNLLYLFLFYWYTSIINLLPQHVFITTHAQLPCTAHGRLKEVGEREFNKWYMIRHICQLQLVWHVVAVVQYTFTHKQYAEQHNETEYTERICITIRIHKRHLYKIKQTHTEHTTMYTMVQNRTKRIWQEISDNEVVTGVLIIKPTRCTNFSNLFLE